MTSVDRPIFTAAGEMASRCRSFDWAATPLGPIESWSHSLRTMADAVIASRNPMLLFWGPHMIQIYNDAFRPSLGPEDAPQARHPRALGMSARDFWVDVWTVVGPMLENVMAKGEAVWFENMYLPIDRGQGRPDDAWWTYSYSPVRDDDGRVNAVLVVCQETTSLMNSMRELSSARELAEAANRAKSDFLAVMSHELRTPLNAIDGYAELLQMGMHGPLTDAQQEDVDRIRRSERHLLALINEVLEYTRIEAGTIEYELADVPLSEVLATCDALTAPQRQAKQLRFRCDPCPANLRVRADQEKLQQIVLNLLTNAIKFTSPGGSIEVTLTFDGPLARVAVTDTGRGIAADHLVSIFEPFVQVDARLTRSNQGIGLGLPISRDLARGMGGDIVVQSATGMGSTFTLSIPLVSVSVTATV